ncbi:MAG: hypothetical protein WA941_06035 [Nitrososphaeraceae archaeon]
MSIITGKMRMVYLDTIRKYMFDDIQVAIDGKANYLAALGLSTYTENLGGLYCDDLQRGSGNHYISFINNYFPKCYGQVDNQLRATSKGSLYKIVRCGLVHEYFMKAESTVTIGVSSKVSCGIIYDPSKRPALLFVVDIYFEDFKKAFSDYYNDLVGATGKATNTKLQSDFDLAINGMLVGPFCSSSGLTGESGSGINLP